MLRVRWLILSILAFGVVAAIEGCATATRREVGPHPTVDGRSPYLKVHMRDGRLYVLSPWAVDSAAGVVRGHGDLLDANRAVQATGGHVVPLDSAVLFETNVAGVSGAVGALGVVTGASVAVTVFCAANAKACFGSCPTFYAFDGARDRLQAEGFSASLAPSLEETDIDHLYRARSDGSTLRLHMLNEALETHVVRRADLLVVPRSPIHRVFVDPDGELWIVRQPVPPLACRAAEGDCLGRVVAFDGEERFSLADSADLAAMEEVELVLPPSGEEPAALVLASRQTLLPTYLLYQVLSYLGTSAGQWLAALERADRDTQRGVDRAMNAIGGIEVLARDSTGGWIRAGSVLETGPLAADVKLVRLPPSRDSLHVRLRMVRGAWRLDWAAATTVVGLVEPLRLAPARVLRDGRDDPAARRSLLSDEEVLVTLPGDAYTLEYDLPPSPAATYEVFLAARGYYLEWMRQEWIAEENPLRALQFFTDPAAALRALAPAYKLVEPEMEAAFWGSKYVGF